MIKIQNNNQFFIFMVALLSNLCNPSVFLWGCNENICISVFFLSYSGDYCDLFIIKVFMSSSFKDDTHAQWMMARYFLFFRNLPSEDTKKLRSLFNDFFPSVESYKHHEDEVLHLLRSNLTSKQKKILERAGEIAVGNTTPDAEDRSVKREANRLKNHMKFLFKKLQDIVYGETVSAHPSRESSPEANPQREETISMEAYESMRNNYEVKVRELETSLHQVQNYLQQQGQEKNEEEQQAYGSICSKYEARIQELENTLRDVQQEQQKEVERQDSINTENAEEHGLETITIGDVRYFINPGNSYVYSRDGALLGTYEEVEQRQNAPYDEEDKLLKDMGNVDLNIFNFMNDANYGANILDIPEIDDLAETHPLTTQTILSTLEPFKGRNILDPCCGKNMMTNELINHGHNMICRDLFSLEEHHDFLVDPLPPDIGFIVAHPPFTMKRAFLERCYDLGKPFALLLPLLSLATEAIGELLHRNGCEVRIIVGVQHFYHENELKNGGYCAWIIGNLPGSNNLVHTYFVGHQWIDKVQRASSFDDTNDLVAEMKSMEIEEKVPEPEPEKKCAVIDEENFACSICWDTLNDETYRIGENCAHPLCIYCWVDYTDRGANQCPVCRQLLKKKRGRGRPRRYN